MTALRPRLLLVAGLAAISVIVLVVVLAGGTSDKPAAPAPVAVKEEMAPVAQPAMPAPTPKVESAAPSAAATDGVPTVEDVLSPDVPNAVLLAALDADDPIVVAESANVLVGRGVISAIPALVEQNVIGRPKAAPSIIYAMGKLGGVADAEQRDAVVDRLVALMHEEKRRNAQESQGNLLQIYEALGDTGSPRAIAPLEGELLDVSVKTAPKVAVVHALVALQATQSRGVLEQLAAQLAPSALETGFEAELRRDLLAAIREALVKLS